MQFYIAAGNERRGPFSLDELKQQELRGETLVWHQGLSTWTRADHIAQLREHLATLPPPLPPPVPPSASSLPNGPSRGLPPSVRKWTWDELRLIASRQRRLIVGIGFTTLAYSFGFPFLMFVVVFWASYVSGADLDSDQFIEIAGGCFELLFVLAMAAVQVCLLIGVANALQLQNAWLWGIGSCLPIVGLVVLLVVNQKAIAALKAASIPVGFFGTTLPDRPPT